MEASNVNGGLDVRPSHKNNSPLHQRKISCSIIYYLILITAYTHFVNVLLVPLPCDVVALRPVPAKQSTTRGACMFAHKHTDD